MSFKNISVLIMLALFIIICIQNLEVIPMHFLFWKVDISKLLLLIITFVAGILVGMIIPGYFRKPKIEEKMKEK